MAISLADIKRAVSGPPRILLYGVEGIGKSTFAAMAPDGVFLALENGVGDIHDESGAPIDVMVMPKPASYEDLLKDSFGFMIEQEHPFKWLVIDTADDLDVMIQRHVCARDNQKSLETYGWDKGYKEVADEARRSLVPCLDAVHQRGIGVIFLAHEMVVNVKPPDSEPYGRYEPRINRYLQNVLVGWFDAVLFANYKVKVIDSGAPGGKKKRGIGDGERVVYTTSRPSHVAKNRYSLPDQMPLDWATFQQAMAQKPATTAPAISS